VTIDALKGEDALSIRPATQTKAGVRLTIFPTQRRVSGGMAIDAARMHKDLVSNAERACGGTVIVWR